MKASHAPLFSVHLISGHLRGMKGLSPVEPIPRSWYDRNRVDGLGGCKSGDLPMLRS